MQTFLPYLGKTDTAFSYYEECASLLDTKRLGKQRVENLQIMKALMGKSGWSNHPVVKMWKGYEFSLLTYQKAICNEWVHNCGYKDTCFDKTAKLYFDQFDPSDDGPNPPWLGDPLLVLSHQSNLIRKDYSYYIKRFPKFKEKSYEEMHNLPYYYPPTTI